MTPEQLAEKVAERLGLVARRSLELWRDSNEASSPLQSWGPDEFKSEIAAVLREHMEEHQ